MAKTKKKRGSGRRKKEQKVTVDATVVGMIIASLLLGVLIYSKAGFLGEYLSPALGGIMGIMKYIIPIGTFFIGIYLACNKGKIYMTSKLTLFVVFLLSIAVLMSTFQISAGTIGLGTSMQKSLEAAYDLGSKDIGGGVLGTIIAVPLVKMIGSVGTIIVAIGVAAVALIFIFRIKTAQMISNVVENLEERREIRKEEKRELREEQRKQNKTGKLYNIDAGKEQTEQLSKKELKRLKKLKEKEEAKARAMEVDENQLKINLKGLDEVEPNMKKYDHSDLTALGQEEPQTSSPSELANLFKQEEKPKEENNIKEVLNLKHTMMVEEEKYEFPPIELLSKGNSKGINGSKRSVTDTAAKLQKTLYSFGVSAKVENVSVGPAITRYELKPAEGVRVSKIANLADDIALNLAAETIRIEAPIPGKQAVGIEVPNAENEMVHLRDIIDTPEFKSHKSNLAFALGKDVAGEAVVTDISKMPHVMIAGATGSGKSVCINTLISSIIYKSKPSEVKMVMIDPKVVELSVYNGIPHLLIPVVTDPRKAAGALAWAVQEMENRYATFAAKGVRDLKGYNDAVKHSDGIGKLPHIVIIIDELADLMMVAKNDVEDAICRLAQKARAAGMHLVIATQRPSVDVITGLIKANIPSRIAFAVSSQVDSRTILDMIGAEKLLGKGDMLFYPAGAPKPTRVQGAYVSDAEVEKIVDFLKAGGEVTYNEDIIEKIENANKSERELEAEQAADDESDPLLMDAIDVVVETGQASTSYIQRKFKVGYARAGRIIDQMEERGVISGYQGSKPREVLLTRERLAELKMAGNNSAGEVQTQVEPKQEETEITTSTEE